MSRRSTEIAGTPDTEPFDGYKFRIVLLGEAQVGKTSLVRRYTQNSFEEEYKQTLGTTFATKDLSIADADGVSRDVRIVLWDMGGQDTYRELRRQYMKGASGAVIVYDVTRPETFMAVNNWFEAFRETCPDAPVVICANKVDLAEKRMVPLEPGVMLQKWLQSEYYETSARTGDNVADVFARMADVVLTRALSDQKQG